MYFYIFHKMRTKTDIVLEKAGINGDLLDKENMIHPV